MAQPGDNLKNNLLFERRRKEGRKEGRKEEDKGNYEPKAKAAAVVLSRRGAERPNGQNHRSIAHNADATDNEAAGRTRAMGSSLTLSFQGESSLGPTAMARDENPFQDWLS